MKQDKLCIKTVDKINDRGVSIEDISKIVFNGQKDMIPNLDKKDCTKAVQAVFRKREAQHIILSGIALDETVERGLLDQPIQTIIYNDEGLYGVDEDLATKLCNLFGSIAETNYGFLDVKKHGIINKIDNDSIHVNTFLDDLIGAIAASAMAWLAHHYDDNYANRVVKN